MAGWLRALVALPEDLCSVSATHSGDGPPFVTLPPKDLIHSLAVPHTHPIFCLFVSLFVEGVRVSHRESPTSVMSGLPKINLFSLICTNS